MSYWTRPALQRETGRSRANIDRLIALGLPYEQVGAGRGGEVRIPRGQALAWLASQVLDGPGEPDEALDLNAERARLAKAQADKTEMENAVARGELLPAAEVAKADEVVFTALRDRVMQVESVSAVVCDLAVAGKPGEARALLRSALRDALEVACEHVDADELAGKALRLAVEALEAMPAA